MHSLPDCLEVTHRSLFDGSLQGIERRDRPAFSFQGHPRRARVRMRRRSLFDHFIALMQRRAG
jgi:carbamoyl-phosphate synthase small subunit